MIEVLSSELVKELRQMKRFCDADQIVGLWKDGSAFILRDSDNDRLCVVPIGIIQQLIEK